MLNENEQEIFKRTQYRLIFSFACGSIFLIYFDLMARGPIPEYDNNISFDILLIVAGIIYNIIFLVVISIAVKAEVIMNKLQSWEKLNNIKGISAFLLLLSFYYILQSSIILIRMIGDLYIIIHASFLILCGIIAPFIWIHRDNKQYNINWIKGIFKQTKITWRRNRR